MYDIRIENESRRRFLQAGLGLTLGIYLAPRFVLAAVEGAAPADAVFEPNAFVRIGTDNTVTVISKHLEMGEGTYTGLATLVAEELDAAWAQVRVEGAPADAKRYANLFLGIQLTGGSTAIANSFEQMRQAGAAARAMLVAAAAERWHVPADSVTVRQGVVMHKKHRATFGELAEAAAALPVPAKVTLKDPAQFTYIGKRFARVDTRAKSNGSAIFTQDIKLPGMLVAVVAHSPLFGSKVRSFDPQRAKAVRGVVEVVEIPSGVAVLAPDFWTAKKGRDLLSIEWDESAALRLSTSEIFTQYRELAAKPGAVARNDGNIEQALAKVAKRVEADYEFPYLAHAPMEPLNCVVRLSQEGCEIWNGEQSQTGDQHAVAAVLGIKPEQVKINMLFAGGSYGRRASKDSDYVVEAVHIAKAINGRAPVKLVWAREDDMRAGHYRPMYLHRLAGGLDEKGNLVAWQQRIVGQSIMAGTGFESRMVKDGVDATSVEGAHNLPYAIPNVLVDLHSPKLQVPVQWWRSVGSSHTAYAVETFLDEAAFAAGKDPVAFRRMLLAKHPRHLGVLELAARKAGWGQPLAAAQAGHKRGRGIAVHKSFNTYVAQVAEVTVRPGGGFTVDRVVCAVDCGIAVNPDVIHAQMEGGIGFGLSAALYGQITLHDGLVEQSNFTDYPVVRMHEMPKVEVYIVESKEKPTGVGEPGVPPIAPAVANALFAASGQRLHKLPLRLA